MTDSQRNLGQKLFSLLYRLLLLILVLLVLTYSLAPLATRLLVVNWLEGQGVDAKFEYLWLSPGVGRLELANFNGQAADDQSFNVGKVVLDLELLPLLNNQIIIEDITLSEVSVTASHEAGSWAVAGLNLNDLSTPSKTVDPEPNTPSAPMQLIVQRMSVEDIKLCVKHQVNASAVADHCIGMGQLKLDGGLSVNLGEELKVDLPGEVSISGIELNDALRELGVVGLRDIRLAQVVYTANHTSLGRFSVGQISLMERRGDKTRTDEPIYHTSLQSVDLQQLDYKLDSESKINRADLNIEALTLSGLNLLVHRDAGEQLPIMHLLDGLQEQILIEQELQERVEQDELGEAELAHSPAPEVEALTEEEKIAADISNPMVVNLKRFYLGDNSRILTIDEQVQPTVERSFNNLTIELTNVSNDADAKPAQLTVATEVGDFGRFDFAGDLLVINPTEHLALKGKLAAIDMLPFSPYVENTMQYQVEKGALNADIDVKITREQLDVDLNLLLDKFYMEGLSQEELPEGDEASTLPVGLALNLLRDNDDRIELALPITGDVNDPGFSVASVFGIVVRKALTAAVLNYYTPFGLVNIGSSLLDSAMELRFDPLLSKPGSVELSAEATAQLDKLATMLAAKAQISLSFCPNITAVDAMQLTKAKAVPEQGWQLSEQQTQQLEDLGINRLKVINNYLQGRGVKATQFVSCQPDLRLTKLVSPSVDISM